MTCLKIYRDFIQRYTDLIGAIQAHERACDGMSSLIDLDRFSLNYFRTTLPSICRANEAGNCSRTDEFTFTTIIS